MNKIKTIVRVINALKFAYPNQNIKANEIENALKNSEFMAKYVNY